MYIDSRKDLFSLFYVLSLEPFTERRGDYAVWLDGSLSAECYPVVRELFRHKRLLKRLWLAFGSDKPPFPSEMHRLLAPSTLMTVPFPVASDGFSPDYSGFVWSPLHAISIHLCFVSEACKWISSKRRSFRGSFVRLGGSPQRYALGFGGLSFLIWSLGEQNRLIWTSFWLRLSPRFLLLWNHVLVCSGGTKGRCSGNDLSAV